MKKILSIILCLALLMGLATIVSADTQTAGLVTSADKLADGQQVVILSNDFTVAMGAHSDNGKYRTVVETATNDAHSVVTLNENMSIITLEKNEDKFALKVDGQYLVCLDDGNSVRLQDAPAYWSISIDVGGMAVISCEHGDRSLQYNSSSPRMACYKNSQASVAIFVLGYEGDIPVSAPSDPKEIVDAAFALEAGEKLPYTATLTGVVTEITAAYDANYGNVSVMIAVEGTTETKSLLCFRIKGEGAETIAVGDTITVTGTIINYNGTIEFNQGSSLDAVVKATTPDPTPEVVTIADGKYIISFGDLSFAALAEDKTYGYPGAGSVAAPTDADYVIITNVGDGKFTIADCYGRYYHMKGTYNSFNVSADAAEGHEWVLEVAGDGTYYLMNVATGKYVSYSEKYYSFGCYEGKADTGVLTFTSAVVEDTPITPAPDTGDMFGAVVALLAVSGMGITVLTKKKF